MALREEREKLLCDFWARRASLTDAEWGSLYSLVFDLLRRCIRCQSLIAQLTGTVDEYIQDFFEDKVMANAFRGDRLYHAGALTNYFYHYLLSQLRRQPAPGRTEDEGALEDQYESADSDGTELTDWIIAALQQREGAPDVENLHQLLSCHVGVKLDVLIGEARAFLSASGPWEHLQEHAWWIRLYLCCHFCPERSVAIPLVTLARKHQVPAYHNKAVRLGITFRGHAVPGGVLAGFSDSHLGRWLVQTGVSVDGDHRDEMMLALKVLCMVALNKGDTS